jgi:hypothetical protein
MRRKAVGLIICAALMSTYGMASATDDDKFDGVDALLSKLVTSTQAGEVTVKPVVTPPPAKPVVKKVETAAAAVVHHTSVPSIGDNTSTPTEPPPATVDTNVLLQRLTELPPGSKFEFTRTLFLPAYKQGVYFIDGEERYQIEKDSDIPKLLLSQSGKTDCAMTSNKNNIKMTGKSSGRQPTFLEVEKVSILKDTGTKDVSLVQIDFKPKRPASVAVDIHVEIICKVPSGDFHSLTLADIHHGTGGLFDYELPRFIEL